MPKKIPPSIQLDLSDEGLDETWAEDHSLSKSGKTVKGEDVYRAEIVLEGLTLAEIRQFIDHADTLCFLAQFRNRSRR